MQTVRLINFLQTRNFYSSRDNLFHDGRFGYNILITLPADLRTSLPDVLVYTKPFHIINFSTGQTANTDFFNLSDVPADNKVYGGMIIEDETAIKLLSYAAIFGGRVEDPMFKKLYVGDRARDLVQETENRDTGQTESYKRGKER